MRTYCFVTACRSPAPAGTSRRSTKLPLEVGKELSVGLFSLKALDVVQRIEQPSLAVDQIKTRLNHKKGGFEVRRGIYI